MQKIKIGKKIITTQRPAFVMGIFNATPDSFFKHDQNNIDYAMRLIEDGADIIDIGGESTKPGFKPVSDQLQLQRILPVIKAIRKVSDIPISVDTRSSLVFKACLEEGADMLNDVSALESDPEVAKLTSDYEFSVILMHGFGQNEEHAFNPHITQDVISYLKNRTQTAIKSGIKSENIFWDLGIGFGKTTEENVFLLKTADNVTKEQFPLVMSLSHKRVIGFMTGKDVENRKTGSVCANMIAVQKGAEILRVHDVSDTIDMLNVMKNLNL